MTDTTRVLVHLQSGPLADLTTYTEAIPPTKLRFRLGMCRVAPSADGEPFAYADVVFLPTTPVRIAVYAKVDGQPVYQFERWE
ncbi:MAG: hypothetical protein AB7G11_11145 [Phycisphaerales bacterium]